MIWNRKYLLGAAAAVGAVGGITAITPQGQQIIGSANADLTTMLNARSPGARTSGAVTTKGPRVALVRTSRVLPITQSPAVRQSAVLPAGVPSAPPAAAAVPTQMSTFGPAPLASGVPLIAAAPGLAAAPAVVGGGLGVAALLTIPVAAALIAPGGGGSFGPIAAPDTTPAIPEPATWLMMIVGFGILGTWLRRRRQSELKFGVGRNTRVAAA